MSYSDNDDAFIDNQDKEEECIQQDDHDYEPSPSGDDSASFISASSSSGKSSVSIAHLHPLLQLVIALTHLLLSSNRSVATSSHLQPNFHPQFSFHPQ
jgi:hypothetical protein